MTEDKTKKSQSPASSVFNISGMGNGFEIKLASELSGSFFFHKGTEHDQMVEKIHTAIYFIQSAKPRDALEAQLLVQMASAHNVAMECLRRANVPDQTFAGRDMGLKHAAKFMNLYMEQMRCLNKHRGKGDQKVVIEHINIESGAQAVVGHVSHGSGNNDRQKSISQETLQTLDPQISMKKEKTFVSRKKQKSSE